MFFQINREKTQGKKNMEGQHLCWGQLLLYLVALFRKLPSICSSDGE